MTHSVTEAIEAIRAGKMVIVTDDDDRENEGDLVMAAIHCTTADMAFIVRHGCGIVCAPVTPEDARRLELDPMVPNNNAPLGTAFTVSVDVIDGLTTGISAEQRANTVRALANRNVPPERFVRPGHVFPLIAREGGVLMRSGHTEAAVDLCRLAEQPPVGVICELANDDGTVMKGEQIADFASQHGLVRISVADLITYRQARDKLVERVATFPVETSIGTMTGYAYRTPFDPSLHFAFVYGNLGDGENVPARLHRANVVEDVLGGGKSLQAALRRIRSAGHGVVVYLRDGTAGVPVTALNEPQSMEALRSRQWRSVGLGAQILRDLEVNSIVQIAKGVHGFVGLSGFGIRIAATEIIDGDSARPVTAEDLKKAAG
jgi:3,4-dihydroxy 2-butanone 4-phosphate synthase/GTP cyclohydrolase II